MSSVNGSIATVTAKPISLPNPGNVGPARNELPKCAQDNDSKPSPNAARLASYSAGIESCFRTIHGAAPEKRANVFKMMAREIFEYVRLSGSDISADVLERFRQAAEANGLVTDFGETAVLRWLSDASVSDGEVKSAVFNTMDQRADGVPPFMSANIGIGDSRELMTCKLSDIAPQCVEWLWPGRIAIGKITMIAGEPGLGKSQTSLFVAAAVTVGGAWPDNAAKAPQGGVIILSAEDGLADTMRPRFDAAGGDASLVYVIRAVKTCGGNGAAQRSFNLAADLALLEVEIKRRGNVRLVIFDPISSYFGKTDSHKNTDVRSVLEPIAEMAERLRVAVLCVTHLSKSDGKAINRFMGSIAFVAAARTAFVVVADPEEGEEERRLFLQVKNNIASPAPGLAFRLVQHEVAAGIVGSFLAWESGTVSVTADEVLSSRVGEVDHTAKNDAVIFLREVLAAGPLPAKEVERLAIEAGMLENGNLIAQAKAFRSARKELRIKPTRKGGFAADGQWVWGMPSNMPVLG